MRKRLAAGISGALAVVALIAAPGASAATEFGSGCVGDGAAPDYTLIQLGGLAAPVSGVITKWKLSVVPEAPPLLPEQLKVLRATGVPGQFQVIGESAISNVSPGANEFDTRVSIQAGDRLGLFGASEVGTLYCRTENPVDIFGAFEGNATTASTAALFAEESKAQIPVLAVIEPDADNDGFGDETQDKCPQSAASQTACPVIAPIALGTSSSVKKGLVNVLVTSSPQAPVTVAGTVKLGKGKSAKLSGGTQVVVPGAIAKFTLLFPEKLKAKLKQLSRKQFLWLNVAVTAPNSAGAISTSELKVKLKGQANPQLHAKAKAKPKGQA